MFVKKFVNLISMVFISFVIITSVFASDDTIRTLPGIGVLTRTEYSGYAGNLFYWFVSSAQNANDPETPIIIWTNGGPGTSSLYGFFNENGPYEAKYNANKQPILVKATDHYDWSKFADYLVIDQPVGIGLSFAPKDKFPSKPKKGNKQYFKALKIFFHQHPQLNQHPIYLAGESYGGTYIAMLAHKMTTTNFSFKYNLHGVIVVSGWVDPTNQYSGMAQYAYQHGMLTFKEQKAVQDNYDTNCKPCNNNNEDCNAVCEKINDQIQQDSGLNLHDIGTTSAAKDWSKGAWVDILNDKTMRQDIHVSDLQTLYTPSTNIWDNYGRKTEDSVYKIYKDLYDMKIPFLIISGMNDASPSGLSGTRVWLKKLFHKNIAKNKQCWVQKESPRKILGYDIQLSENNNNWITVFSSGHTVPVAQPLIAELVNKFVTGTKLSTTKLEPCAHNYMQHRQVILT